MDGDGVIDRDGIGDGAWVVDGDGVGNGDWADDQVESYVTNNNYIVLSYQRLPRLVPVPSLEDYLQNCFGKMGPSEESRNFRRYARAGFGSEWPLVIRGDTGQDDLCRLWESMARWHGDVFNGNKILLKASVDRSAPEIFHVGYGSLQTLLVKALTPLSKLTVNPRTYGVVPVARLGGVGKNLVEPKVMSRYKKCSSSWTQWSLRWSLNRRSQRWSRYSLRTTTVLSWCSCKFLE
ncbi:hypothetical protein LguiA_026385 [Lonicera macranthoides]